MRVILTEDVPKLGAAGEVVKVKPGYGRNYLLPKGMAELATDGRVKQLEHQKRVIEEKVKKQVSVHQELANRMKSVALSFQMQTNEEGKLFGSVTNGDIQHQLADRGFEIERRKIELSEPIKQVGDVDVNIRLHHDVQFQIVVSVVSSGMPPPPVFEEEELSQAEAAMEEAETRPADGDE